MRHLFWLVVIFIIVAVAGCGDVTCQQTIEEIKASQYSGYVLKKWEDMRNKGTPVIDTRDTSIYMSFYEAAYDSIMVGDSFYKAKGTLQFVIIGKEKQIFYPVCGGIKYLDSSMVLVND